MKKGVIILALVFLVVLYILQKTQTVKRLDFSVGTPRNISLRGGELSFILPLNIRNPSKGSIRLKSAEFNLFAGSKYLGKALSSEALTIGPQATTVLNIQVAITYLDLIGSVLDLWEQLKGNNVQLTIDGLVFAEGFQVPYKNTFAFSLPKL